MHSIDQQWTAKSHLELSCKVGFSSDIMCRPQHSGENRTGQGVGLILVGYESSVLAREGCLVGGLI